MDVSTVGLGFDTDIHGAVKFDTVVGFDTFDIFTPWDFQL